MSHVNTYAHNKYDFFEENTKNFHLEILNGSDVSKITKLFDDQKKSTNNQSFLCTLWVIPIGQIIFILNNLSSAGSDVSWWVWHYVNYLSVKNKFNDLKHVLECGSKIQHCCARGLLTACSIGNFEVIQLFVSSGVNVRLLSHKLLVEAFTHGNLNIIKYLVDNGAILSTAKNDVLKIASGSGNLKCVKYALINGITDEDNTSIMEAMSKCNFDIAKELICFGSSPANCVLKETLLKKLCLNREFAVLKIILNKHINHCEVIRFVKFNPKLSNIVIGVYDSLLINNISKYTFCDISVCFNKFKNV